ncbi:hypothetical protein ACTPEW_12225 [Clostridioides difficile]
MNILTSVILVVVSFIAGRIYEYRLNLKEFENYDNTGGFKNE